MRNVDPKVSRLLETLLHYLESCWGSPALTPGALWKLSRGPLRAADFFPCTYGEGGQMPTAANATRSRKKKLEKNPHVYTQNEVTNQWAIPSMSGSES